MTDTQHGEADEDGCGRPVAHRDGTTRHRRAGRRCCGRRVEDPASVLSRRSGRRRRRCRRRHADAAADADCDARRRDRWWPEVIDEDALVYEHDDEPAPKPMSPYDRPGRWFVVHTQSGYENKVKQNLEARTSSMHMENRIHEIVIPMEDVVEFKAGKKVTVQKKVFPGYLLVRCNLDDDSWFVIRNTPGITGFVGAGNKPIAACRAVTSRRSSP